MVLSSVQIIFQEINQLSVGFVHVVVDDNAVKLAGLLACNNQILLMISMVVVQNNNPIFLSKHTSINTIYTDVVNKSNHKNYCFNEQ
jgi:hypothetical protein